jgi:hypothetical protein
MKDKHCREILQRLGIPLTSAQASLANADGRSSASNLSSTRHTLSTQQARASPPSAEPRQCYDFASEFLRLCKPPLALASQRMIEFGTIICTACRYEVIEALYKTKLGKVSWQC